MGHPPHPSVGPGGQWDQEHGVVLHDQEESDQPTKTSRTKSSEAPQSLSDPPSDLGGQMDSEIKDMG